MILGVIKASIAGHSLGGALATLAAYDIQAAFGIRDLQVYTYGAPRTGNYAFARCAASHLGLCRFPTTFTPPRQHVFAPAAVPPIIIFPKNLSQFEAEISSALHDLQKSD